MINSKKRDLSGKNFCKPVKKRIPHNENIPTIFESELHALNILYYNEENEDGLDDKFRDVSVSYIINSFFFFFFFFLLFFFFFFFFLNNL